MIKRNSRIRLSSISRRLRTLKRWSISWKRRIKCWKRSCSSRQKLKPIRILLKITIKIKVASRIPVWRFRSLTTTQVTMSHQIQSIELLRCLKRSNTHLRRSHHLFHKKLASRTLELYINKWMIWRSIWKNYRKKRNFNKRYKICSKLWRSKNQAR